MNKLLSCRTGQKVCLAIVIFASSIAVHAHASTLYFANSFNYVYNGTLYQYNQFAGNGTTAAAGGSNSGITVSSSANLPGGTLKIYNQGTATNGMTAASTATIGDTITAHGSTGGLNLGVNINVGGTVADSTPANNNTFLVVDVLPVGAFDQSNYFSNILYSQIDALGPDTTPTQAWQTYGSQINASYPSGSNAIALNIPFNTIGSNFQIFVGLFSYEIGSGAGVWDTDYTDPFTVSLSAPGGVTLSSAGGIPGTVSPVPEPASAALLFAGFAVFAVIAGRRMLVKRDGSFVRLAPAALQRLVRSPTHAQ